MSPELLQALEELPWEMRHLLVYCLWDYRRLARDLASLKESLEPEYRLPLRKYLLHLFSCLGGHLLYDDPLPGFDDMLLEEQVKLFAQAVRPPWQREAAETAERAWTAPAEEMA